MTNLRLLLVVALLVSGCAPPVPAPLATPAREPPAAGSTAPALAPAPAATPLGRPATSAPAPSPTPIRTAVAPTANIPDGLSPDQRAAFAAARQLLVEGKFTDAAEQWRGLRQVPAAAAEARVGLALALALAGAGAAAFEVLDAGPEQADARDPYVRGLALDAANQHAQGMRLLADYATANPLVGPAVWLELSERELNARRPRESADAATHGLEAAQARSLKQRLLEVRAQALAALGETEAAFDAHRQVLALATSSSSLGEQLFRLAQASRDLGKRDAAVQALKTALDQFPSASTTADALRLLDELGAADQLDPFVLGRARYFAVDFRNAVSAFNQYLQVDPNGPDASGARLYRALASLVPGNEPNALRELDAIADDPTQETEIAAQALLEAGQALEALSEPDQAEARYQRLLDRFPRLDAAATAGFRLGLARYVRGADTDAIAAWDALLVRRDDLAPDDVSRALYWRGKAQVRLSRSADARTSFEQASAVRPSGFYALRAWAQLRPASNSSVVEPSVSGADEQQLAQWLASHNQDLTTAAGVVAGDAALARAQADASIGLFREGNWEADELLQRYPDRADRLYVLARRFAELGLVGGATRLGQAAYRAASIQTPQDAPQALLKVAFPRPFATLTDSAAVRYGVDQLLLEATFHEASQFDAWADSPASGARGLAQMSPVHADETARGLGLDAGGETGAAANVEAQAWLVADRLRRFDGRPEVALSAIATTDRLVDGWLVRRGAEDTDDYIESIDYEGVRAGLRALFATRLSYAIAYGPPAGSVTSGDPLEAVRVRPEPTAAWIKIARLNGDLPPDAPLAPPIDVGSAELRSAMDRGAVLQRDGDYDAALDVFRTAATSADPTVAQAGKLRVGQALVAAGRPAEALEPLRAVAAQTPASPATFLIGRALAIIGQCQQALAAFEGFAASNPGPLASYAQAAEAGCLADLGRADAAVPLLERAAANPDVARLQTIDFRERLALMRVRTGDLDGARGEYAALLAAARSASYRAELTYYLGVLAPDPATAASRFRSAVQLDPKSRAAQAALDELVALGDPFALSLEAGDTRFEQNRYREALAAYSSFLQQNPADGRAPKAYYGRGVALVRLGQDRAGIAALESTADRFPNTVDAADGVFRGGRIRESLGDLAGAAQAYQRVMAMSGAGARATDAQFRLAFVQLRQGNYSAAIDGWRDLTSRVSAADDRAQAWFWLGKALRASGDEAGARTAWSSARATDPRGFYGLRAGDLLGGATDPRAQIDLTLPLVQAAIDPLRSVTAWAASRGDVASAQQRLNSDAGLGRVDVLLAMGLRQPAIWELGAVEARLGSNASAVALLGGWEQQRGLYNTALVLGYDLAGMANVSLASGSPAVRRLVYPLPHPAQLAQAAQQVRLDPLLFAGLMWQESNLDQSIESSAQARGLSQLIASTGYDAARALGLYGFRGTDLFKPKVSITLGAFTFAQRLRRYDQRIFPALAAYNAAQFAVDGWLLAAGEADVDTFAEAIPFTETYPYVQHIYENYKQYLELYGNQ